MKFLKNKLFVSVLLSTICLLCSFGLCTQSNMVLSFKIATNKAFEAQVFFQNTQNSKFSEHHSVKQNVRAGTQNVSIKIPAKHIYKIRLDFGNKPGAITVDNIIIHAKTSVVLDPTQFQPRNIESYSVTNNQIIINSNSHDPYIIYKPTLNIENGVFIDWCMLFILACLYFFGFYKLYDYLPHLLRGFHRPHSVFVILFFILLCVPVLHISNATKSDTENRMLATHPSLFAGGAINNKFGAEFDAWFNDRFLGRKLMTDINSYVRIFLSKHYEQGNTKIYYNDWIFAKDRTNDKHLSDQQQFAIKQSIDSFNNWCSQHKIKCYIEIVPRKLNYATDQVFRYVHESDPSETLYTYLLDSGIDNIIWPTQEMYEANQTDMVYFKTDHHWTDSGAFAGYQAFMKRLKSDFPKIKTVSDKDYETFYDNKVRAGFDRKFTVGRQCELLLLNKLCPLDVQYKYYKNRSSESLVEQRNESIRQKEYEFNAPNKQKIVVVGNSFAENMMEFVPYTFSKTKKIRWNTATETNIKMSRWNKEILDYKPDILLILLESESVHRLKDLKD